MNGMNGNMKEYYIEHDYEALDQTSIISLIFHMWHMRQLRMHLLYQL